MNKKQLIEIIENRICKIKKPSFSKSSPFFEQTENGFYYDKEEINKTVSKTVEKINTISSYKDIVKAFINDIELYTTDKPYFLAFLYAIISDLNLDNDYYVKEKYISYKSMNREYGLPYQKIKPKLKLQGYLDNGYPNEKAIINGLARIYFIENYDEEQNIVKIMWKKEFMDEILGTHSDIEKLGFIHNAHNVDSNLYEISVRLLEIIDKKDLEDQYDERISDVCHHSWLMYSECVGLLNDSFEPLFDKAVKIKPRITKQLRKSYENNINYIKRKS